MKVSDLTVEQFRFLVEEIIDRKLKEYFGVKDEEPDKIPPEISESLKEQMMSKAVGIPDEQLLKDLGINQEE
jgi:hypothetical protein